jgi:hypothetical protein
LYEVNLKSTSEIWNTIKINKNETYLQQCKQKRRPRICWTKLYPQIINNCKIIFNDNIDVLLNFPETLES